MVRRRMGMGREGGSLVRRYDGWKGDRGGGKMSEEGREWMVEKKKTEKANKINRENTAEATVQRQRFTRR